jgi:DNA-binding beta-propeller fold protein YncE
MKSSILYPLLVAACAIAASPVTAQQKGSYHVVNTYHIASPGGWDYIAAGPGNNRLYVSHGSQVNILNETTGDSVGVIPNTTGVHGIAFVKDLNKGYTSNGRINNVTVFDLATNRIITQVATGENPDAIMYDTYSKKVITCNGRGKNLSVIDPASDKVVATIDLGGKPETAVSDEAGKIYVNIEDKSEIAVVNIATNTVEARWPLAPGEGPSGLAIDTKTKRLFSGCDDKLLVVMDATNGRIVSKQPIGEGCDGVAFDSGTKTIFSSNGEGTVTVIREKSANDFAVLENAPTKKGARTIAVDEATHTLYLPTAEFETGGLQGRRPPMKPGTFQVLVVKE